MSRASRWVWGLAGGAMLAIMASAGLYLSPWRLPLFGLARPGFHQLQVRVRAERDSLETLDAALRAASGPVDSLAAIQARLQAAYLGDRQTLTRMAGSQARPGLPGLADWVVRLWPGLALLFLACLASVRGVLWLALPRTAPRRVGVTGPGAAADPDPRRQALERALRRLDAIRAAAPPDPAGAPPSKARTRAEDTETQVILTGENAPSEPPPPARPPKTGRFRRLFMEDEDETATEAAPAEAASGPSGPSEHELRERLREDVLRLARRGMTSSEISRRLRVSQDQVEIIIRLRREKG